MNKLFVFVGAAAVAVASSVASAQYGGINSLAVAPYWFSDYFGSNLNINGTNHSDGAAFVIPGLAGMHLTDDSFPGGPHFTNRHHAALASGGTPFTFNPGTSFKFDVDVLINGIPPARTEAGIWLGTAPSFPSSAGADVGQFVALPDNGGEIAAFGGTLPFFSNNQAENAGMPRAIRGVSVHLSMLYYGAENLVVYSVNGVATKELSISYNGNPGFAPNSLMGVYVQGPNIFGNATGQVDVTFSNLTITIPTPASAALLGMGGLVATRRRR